MSTRATVYMDFVEVQLDKNTKLRFSPGDGVIVPGIYIERDDGAYARINIFAEVDGKGEIIAHIERGGKDDKEITILSRPKQEFPR